MEEESRIRLVIESRIENLSLVGGAVRGIANTLHFDEVNSYHLELCLVEAVSNTMKHAYRYEAGHFVEVEILRFPDRITFKISDRGKSLSAGRPWLFYFDPNDFDALPESGMGLFIMNTLMDEATYETVGGVNVLTLSKYL